MIPSVMHATNDVFVCHFVVKMSVLLCMAHKPKKGGRYFSNRLTCKMSIMMSDADFIPPSLCFYYFILNTSVIQLTNTNITSEMRVLRAATS